jgi:tetratricopeptide (TPR) repeat protein
VPRGSVLKMRFTYDNSANDPRNPKNPPIPVLYGVQTSDEMAELWLQLLPHNLADATVLMREYEKKLFQDGIEFAQYRLRLNPNDAKAHIKYGQFLIGAKRNTEALGHFQKAAAVEPQNDKAHYFIGLIARMQNKLEIAGPEFAEAVRLNPNHAKALGNLALIQLERKHVDEARKNFLRVVELEPRIRLPTRCSAASS